MAGNTTDNLVPRDRPDLKTQISLCYRGAERGTRAAPGWEGVGGRMGYANSPVSQAVRFAGGWGRGACLANRRGLQATGPRDSVHTAAVSMNHGNPTFPALACIRHRLTRTQWSGHGECLNKTGEEKVEEWARGKEGWEEGWGWGQRAGERNPVRHRESGGGTQGETECVYF